MDCLRRMGPFAALPVPVIASARRFLRRRIVCRQLLNTLLVSLFKLGVSAQGLARSIRTPLGTRCEHFVVNAGAPLPCDLSSCHIVSVAYPRGSRTLILDYTQDLGPIHLQESLQLPFSYAVHLPSRKRFWIPQPEIKIMSGLRDDRRHGLPYPCENTSLLRLASSAFTWVFRMEDTFTRHLKDQDPSGDKKP